MVAFTFFQRLEEYSSHLVSAFTFGQLSAAKEVYLKWLSTAPPVHPTILSQFLALLFVVLKFLVPVFFVAVVLSKLTKNIYLIGAGICITAIAYSLLYFNPITTYEHLSVSIQAFWEFLTHSSSMTTSPVIFTFLNNGLAVFAIHMIVGALLTWVFFAIVLGLVTIILTMLLGGRNPWDYTEKKFKHTVTLLTVVFLIFWSVFGSFKGLIMTVTFLFSMFSISSGIRTMMGYERYCYNDGGEVVCKWVKK